MDVELVGMLFKPGCIVKIVDAQEIGTVVGVDGAVLVVDLDGHEVEVDLTSEAVVRLRR